MLIPIRTDYRMTHMPWVNYGLIAVNVVLFAMGFNAASPRNSQRIDAWLLDPESLQLFQFFSSVFLHAHWAHLAGNMLFLWVFGNAVNDRLGHGGYLAFYLAGGVLAGLGYVLMSGEAPLLGASGAIAAVTGAYLVLLPRARVTVLLVLYFITYFEISSLYFLMFQFIFNLVMSLTPDITGRSAGGIAYAAHSTGYAFGIAVSVLLLALRVLPRDVFDLLNLFRTARRRHQYRTMLARGYDPFGHGMTAPPQTVRPVEAVTVMEDVPDTPAARELQLRREISEAYGRNDFPAAAEKYLQLVQIADQAVLSRQQQLDMANQLMTAERHPAAADAYERFLKHYANYEHVGDIFLMLGLLYGRYLQQDNLAETYLQRATEKLRDPRKLNMARGDLQAVRQRRYG